MMMPSIQLEPTNAITFNRGCMYADSGDLESAIIGNLLHRAHEMMITITILFATTTVQISVKLFRKSMPQI